MDDRDRMTSPPPKERSVPPVVAPPPGGHPRFPLFDSLRAVAVLSVLILHAAMISQAYESPYYGHLVRHLDIGVTIFFLISGFLLYRPFVAGRAGQARAPRVRDFARRRVLRIVPAYWLVLIIFGIYPGLNIFTGDWWVHFGLLQGYPVYEHHAACQSVFRNCGISPAWSLAVEVSFYALLPLYAILMARLARGRTMRQWIRLEVVALGALAAGSVLLRLHAAQDPGAAYMARTLLGTFYWFALGMGLAIASVALRDRESESRLARVTTAHPAAPWLLALAAYVTVSRWLPASVTASTTDVQWVTGYIVFGLVAALLLLPAVFGEGAGGLPRRILANPALAWLGLISYGIFLWHTPVMGVLNGWDVLDWVQATPFATLTLAAAVISIAGATLSYYLVERPFLQLKDRRLKLAVPRVERRAVARTRKT